MWGEHKRARSFPHWLLQLQHWLKTEPLCGVNTNSQKLALLWEFYSLMEKNGRKGILMFSFYREPQCFETCSSIHSGVYLGAWFPCIFWELGTLRVSINEPTQRHGKGAHIFWFLLSNVITVYQRQADCFPLLSAFLPALLSLGCGSAGELSQVCGCKQGSPEMSFISWFDNQGASWGSHRKYLVPSLLLTDSNESSRYRKVSKNSL